MRIRSCRLHSTAGSEVLSVSMLEYFEMPLTELMNEVEDLNTRISYCSHMLVELEVEQKCTVMMLMAEMIETKNMMEDIILVRRIGFELP